MNKIVKAGSRVLYPSVWQSLTPFEKEYCRKDAVAVFRAMVATISDEQWGDFVFAVSETRDISDQADMCRAELVRLIEEE